MRTVQHFLPDFSRWLGAVPDSRYQPYVDYKPGFLLWWGLLLFVLKLGSRRQLDFDLRSGGGAVLANVNRLAQTGQKSLPVHKTLDHFLGHMGPEALAEMITKTVRRLIRMRALDHCRMPSGHFAVAVDGTGHLTFKSRHCDHCLTRRHNGKTLYMHHVFEAKLVSPSGLALSIGSEFIENPAELGAPGKSAEKRKQDCELKALARLAVQLKSNFPRTPICLTADALHACGVAIQIATDNGWAFFFTFKKGRLPALWQEFQNLLTLCPENKLRVCDPDGTIRDYRWINGLDYRDSEKRQHMLNAIQCRETKNGKTTTFAWITNITVTTRNVDGLALTGGRIRFKIENQGFNTQKNSGMNLEHAYSIHHVKSFYLLMQLAHILLQLLEHGSLITHLARRLGRKPMQLFGSLKNIARRLLECLRYFILPGDAFAPGALRIRLDSS